MEHLSIEAQLDAMCDRARKAARALAPVGREQKDRALRAVAEALVAAAARPSAVLDANAADVAAARAAGLSDALVDRLVLDEARLRAIASAVLEIAAFDDPVGEIIGMKRRPTGLLIGQARPNVTVDAAALCLKSGNAALLRGGKEAARSNAALASIVRDAIASVGLPADAVQVVPPGSREEIKALVGMTGKIDLVIPRGGEGLIRYVAEHARVPVIQHYKGVCHLYVDAEADLDMAYRLVENGKLQRPGVCNALECLLVCRASAPALLPRLGVLIRERGLEVRADDEARALVPGAKPATEADWGTEFLAPILAVRVLGSLDEALAHIAQYGSNHTEVICTTRYDRAQRFLREVDASCVLVNASSRFNDGGELGLGAEIGISTTKLHAYGPMGLESLTALKWIAHGDGQTR